MGVHEEQHPNEVKQVVGDEVATDSARGVHCFDGRGEQVADITELEDEDGEPREVRQQRSGVFSEELLLPEEGRDQVILGKPRVVMVVYIPDCSGVVMSIPIPFLERVVYRHDKRQQP